MRGALAVNCVDLAKLFGPAVAGAIDGGKGANHDRSAAVLEAAERPTPASGYELAG
jgi:hypothetical protein